MRAGRPTAAQIIRQRAPVRLVAWATVLMAALVTEAMLQREIEQVVATRPPGPVPDRLMSRAEIMAPWVEVLQVEALAAMRLVKA